MTATRIVFNAEVSFNSKLESQRLLTAARTAQLTLDRATVRDMRPLTPYKTGAMQRSLTGIGTGEMTYGVVYDRYQYFGDGFNYTKKTHPAAQSRWFETAFAQHGVSWIVDAAAAMNKYLSSLRWGGAR